MVLNLRPFAHNHCGVMSPLHGWAKNAHIIHPAPLTLSANQNSQGPQPEKRDREIRQTTRREIGSAKRARNCLIYYS